MPSQSRRSAKSKKVSPTQNIYSGDFRGANLNFNIKSTLTNVEQNVSNINTSDQTTRRELEKLIRQLSDELQKIPADKQEEVQTVAETAKVLVDSAKGEKPNKTMLKITAEGLKQAAQNLADVMPTIVPIASQIALTVMKLVGG
jgi:septal ring factor EnvC (AmiA/AmiB activator)